MLLSLIMDGIVAALLVATIGFAVKLNGRLAALRSDSERLQGLIKGLQGASGAAEEAVGALKRTAADAGGALQDTIDKGRSLEADLRFLTDRATEAANRLEAALRIRRDQQSNSVAGAAGPGGLAAPQHQATGASPVAAPVATATDAKGGPSRLAMLLKQADGAAASVGRSEPTLDREVGRPKPRPVALSHESARTEPAPQSRAERELLRALEARSRQ
jgi:hypothetical protein